jgi:hypothetical protein
MGSETLGHDPRVIEDAIENLDRDLRDAIWIDVVDAVRNAFEQTSIGQTNDGLPANTGCSGQPERHQTPLSLCQVADAEEGARHAAKHTAWGIFCSKGRRFSPS